MKEKNMARPRLLQALLLMLVIITACREREGLFEYQPLISSGRTVITVNDYLKALEVTKTAYPHALIVKNEAFKTIKTRLLSQLIEELVIMKSAEEKQITVSDTEFKAEVEAIKKDYPEGVFEEMFIENAMTERLWETRLRQRMLMEKVLEAELDGGISVSPEDMTRYYEENAAVIEEEFDHGQDEAEVYDRILKRMKLEKKQAAYQAWIDRKKSDYSIEVNQKIWEKILDL
ncbi:hypothetical protein JCM14469_26030 [Desulfatiferula olefinivorans]